MKIKETLKPLLLVALLMEFTVSFAQEKSLVNTLHSPYAKLSALNMTDVRWTNGFWAERYHVCQESMVPHMMNMYLDDSISHGFANFEIAAGLKPGEHVGPPFHDGDFYKMLEALIMVNAISPDKKTDEKIDSIIDIIGKTQRADGYIHTPVVIEQLINKSGKNEFAERMDFETYNIGHLMTAACIHYRLTGKKNLMDIAVKATDFLYEFYKKNAFELANNAICPSHYMGVVEMYRTLGYSRYLELSKALVDIRSMVKNGHDHNQDRIPFRKQVKAQGHAVRANYLYAGVADVYAETGDDSLKVALDAIWHDLVETKLYITGACGALYDGVSPNGTTYDQPSIQQVHQAYGQDYELPNLTAHNESCANIGNMLWNWRMLQVTGEARFADVMEQVMYNSLLAAVSLDGLRHFYTNPLAVSSELPYELRWSKDREEYITYCNCCPPNTIRTIAEMHNYMYSLSDEGLWVNFYGGNNLKTALKDQSVLELEQVTDYPWDGDVKLKIGKSPKKEFAMFVRIPGWCSSATISVNGVKINEEVKPGTFHKLLRKWNKGDEVEINMPMDVVLVEANPLVEETRNQVAVQRGPVVYCVESTFLPEDIGIYNVAITAKGEFKPVKVNVAGASFVALDGEAVKLTTDSWKNRLYRQVSTRYDKKVPIRLIPYYAWDNQGKCDMSIWIPFVR